MIKLDEFEAWLRGFPQDEIIAISRDCHNCPVAKFLVHQGHSDVLVSVGAVLIDEEPHSLPEWTAVLIEHIDLVTENQDTDYVTAQQVLTVLNRVKTSELNRIGSTQ
jgi:hypothetical protein